MKRGQKVCIPLAPKSAEELRELVEKALSFEPELIEIRFDALEPAELAAGVREAAALSHRCKFIATFRPREEGGLRELTVDERERFWRDLPEGFWAVDVEKDAVSFVEHPNKIVSKHFFEDPPDDLQGVFDELSKCDTAAVKLAVASDDAQRSLAVWKTLLGALERKREAIVIAMGDAGKWTRVLGPAHGALLTYSTVASGKATAPGQLSAKDAIGLYAVGTLDRATRVYGVIGDPIGHSLSPYIHNPLFKNAGLNAVFVPFRVKDLSGFIENFVREGTRTCGFEIGGLSVTMPHKIAIMEILDDLDPSARKANAVNTVTVSNDRLIGSNTDIDGVIEPLKKRLGSLNAARVAVIGAGGAARACVAGLLAEEAKVSIFARDPKKAERLAGNLDIEVRDLRSSGNGNELLRFDVLINATPLGMHGAFENISPLPATSFREGQIAFDLVTKNGPTPFLRDARASRAATIEGLEMLVEQGIRQFATWTGISGDRELVERSIAEAMSDREQ